MCYLHLPHSAQSTPSAPAAVGSWDPSGTTAMSEQPETGPLPGEKVLWCYLIQEANFALALSA